MRTKHTIRTVWVVCILLGICASSWAGSLTAADMYLDPASISEASYTYASHTAGYTATFSNVKKLQVLPVLDTAGDYYFTPTVDYSGDITNGAGSVTFTRAGPYFVLATYTDSTTKLFDYGVDFEVHGNTTGPTYNWTVIDTPAPDVVVTDPDLADSNPDFGSGTTEVNDKTTWAQVTAYLQTLENQHVELGGHGAPGEFYWDGVKVLDDSTAATKTWLESMKGHINYLTFMSCSTGAGSEGTAFLTGVAQTLGKSAGYTDVVGGNGSEWFINGDGKLKIVPLPSGAWLCLFGLACVAMARRRRRSP